MRCCHQTNVELVERLHSDPFCFDPNNPKHNSKSLETDSSPASKAGHVKTGTESMRGLFAATCSKLKSNFSGLATSDGTFGEDKRVDDCGEFLVTVNMDNNQLRVHDD